MIRLHLSITLVLTLICAQHIDAAVLDGLYETTVRVETQEKKARKQAFEKAFEIILIRVSGDSQIKKKVALIKAGNYVLQYKYRESQPQKRPAGNMGGALEPVPGHELWVQFNARHIDTLLRESSQSVWGKQRPVAIVWLAVRDGQHRYLLKDGDSSLLKTAIEEAAKRRGLPTQWPLMDLTDQQAVGFADVWGGFWKPVVNVSRRYTNGPVLAGMMTWTGNSWDVSWNLIRKNTVYSWQLQSPDYELVIASGMDLTIDVIAQEYVGKEVIDSIDPDRFYVEVVNIDNAETYVAATRYLVSLSAVKQAYITRVSDRVVRFYVDVRTNIKDLKRIIGLGTMLEPISNASRASNDKSVGPGDAENILRYRIIL